MKLRTSFLVSLLVFALLAAPRALAQGSVATATLTGSNGSSVVNITSNQSFTLTLTIQTNFVSSGMTYFFRSNAAGSGLFRITTFDATGSPYPPSPLICSGPGDPCLLDPVNNNDLGGGGGPDTIPPGTYTIATFTFSTLNAPLGQYTISLDRAVITDRTGGNFQDVALFATATINVVPEPGTVSLGVLGGAVLSVSFWRKRRRRAHRVWS
jgi:hypothetical protein